MPAYGKNGKPQNRFPLFPQTLESDTADFHIPSATTARSIYPSQNNPERSLLYIRPLLLLQAHSSIGKVLFWEEIESDGCDQSAMLLAQVASTRRWGWFLHRRLQWRCEVSVENEDRSG